MPQHARPFSDYRNALSDLTIGGAGSGDPLIEAAVCDSRDAVPGALFVAIPGARDDGARYTLDALARGAVAVVATRPLDLPHGVPLIQVRDAYAAAARVAEIAYDRPAAGMRLLGVTGTNGKTTTAFLLQDILRRAGRLPGMIGTVHYDIAGEREDADRTTPTPFLLQALFDRMRRAGVVDVVLEVSSHALHQHRLGRASLSGGIFTNLSGDHLDYHGTMEDYFAAKRLMFTEYLPADAPAVVNADDEYGQRLACELRTSGGRRTVTFGRTDVADYRMRDLTSSVRGSSMMLATGDDELSLSSPLIGYFNLYNIAGAVALALECGVSPKIATSSVADFAGAPGRLEAIPIGHGATAFVDYAHTDDALVNVCAALRELSPRRLMVLFGCGGDRDRTKRPRMAKAAERFADVVYVTSDNPRTEDPEAIIAEIATGFSPSAVVRYVTDRWAAIRAAVAEAAAGDILLIAGKGHEPYQEIDGERYDFSDVCEVRNAAVRE